MQRPSQIIGLGRDQLSAIQAAFDQLVGAGGESGVNVRIQAEGVDQETAVRHLAGEMAESDADYGRGVAGVVLDGLRPIEGGWRIWGSVWLGASGSIAREMAVAGVQIERVEDGVRVVLTVEQRVQSG